MCTSKRAPPGFRVGRRLAWPLLVLCVVPAAAAAGLPRTSTALAATAFSVTSGSAPFAGDRRLLATISPNGDGLRDRAAIGFTLGKAATATLTVRRTWPSSQVVFTRTARLAGGRHVVEWAPRTAGAGTYIVRLVLDDGTGDRRVYDAGRARHPSSPATPVVRVLGLEGAFARESARPDTFATLEVSTDAPSFSFQIFRAGPRRVPPGPGTLPGAPVTGAVSVDWRAHRNGPGRIRVRAGNWRGGLYYARLTTGDGRFGYAPIVVGPSRLGEHRIAVVLPTNTWQAYNRRDGNGDGVGDTWYAGCDGCTVRLGRPYLDHGVPPHFRRYDLPFLRWLGATGRKVDFLTDTDLERVPTGARLARAYDLVVFPGHHEYVTGDEYDVVARYRNLGGNLVFLSANNFYWRVVRHGRRLERALPWRELGRPEAALIGVQYRASDHGERRGAYVVQDTPATRWLFAGTGLVAGSRLTAFGSARGVFGVEIDATAAASPPGTTVVAEIPSLFGPGIDAQMTYYETPRGARVFAAGAFTLAGAAMSQPVRRVLDNLWGHLARP